MELIERPESAVQQNNHAAFSSCFEVCVVYLKTADNNGGFGGEYNSVESRDFCSDQEKSGGVPSGPRTDSHAVLS